MPRYKLTIAYDGTDFCGWQKQEPLDPSVAGAAMHPKPETIVPGVGARSTPERPRVILRTVQHVVEQAVREVVREPVMLQGASRTDAGVHARGQVAAFTCGGDGERDEETERRGDGVEEGVAGTNEPNESSEGALTVSPSRRLTVSREPAAMGAAGPVTPPRGSGWPLSRGTDRLVKALNSRLPEDVLVLAAEAVAADFDPVRHAIAKAYTYTLHVSQGRPLWDRRYVHHVWVPLDVEAMRRAAERIVGEHDFVAFAAAGHGRLTTVRTVFECTVAEAAAEEPATAGAAPSPSHPTTVSPSQTPLPRVVRIRVSGSGFLYNMVRIIAGTLVEVGRGRMTAEDVTRAIESKDRRSAGPTLGPEGLCLEWVRYGTA